MPGVISLNAGLHQTTFSSSFGNLLKISILKMLDELKMIAPNTKAEILSLRLQLLI